MQCSSTIKRIDKIELYGRFGSDTGIVLCPVERNATSMLNIRGIIWTRKKYRAWRVEGRCQNFRDYLFCFDIIRNISLLNSVKSQDIIYNAYQIVCPALQKTCSSKVSRASCYHRNVDSTSINRQGYDPSVKLLNSRCIPTRLLNITMNNG